jgi:hypothetical protein
MPPRYHDKEWLEQKYHAEKNTQPQIADICGVSDATICRWFDKHGIESRAEGVYQSMAHPGVSHRIAGNDEYERVSLNHDRTTYHVAIHRLCAVAWFGISYFDPRDVHHKDGCRSHNAEENLQIVEHEEHLREHTNERWESGDLREKVGDREWERDDNGRFVSE